MIRKAIVICLLLYISLLLQMSFLVHMLPSGWVPNLIIMCVLLFAVLERRDSPASLVAALFGGFLLDIFSGGIIGVWAVVLVLLSIGIKFVLESYVRFPIPKKF